MMNGAEIVSHISHMHAKITPNTDHVLIFVDQITYNNNSNNSLHRFFHWQFTYVYMQRDTDVDIGDGGGGAVDYFADDGRVSVVVTFDQKEQMANIIIIITLWVGARHIHTRCVQDAIAMISSEQSASRRPYDCTSYGDQSWW